MSGFKVKKGLISRKEKDKTTIFDSENSQLLTLNKTASLIFSLIKRGKNKKDIITQLSKKYGSQEERIKSDVSELIENLKLHKIIQ